MDEHEKLREAIKTVRQFANARYRHAGESFDPMLHLLCDAAESTLPKTKMVEVWRVEWVQYETPKAFSQSEGDGADSKRWAEDRANWLGSSLRGGYRCIRVTGPHMQEVPA